MKPYSLVGIDGNAYTVMGYTSSAMLRAGFGKAEIDKMFEEATSSDYNNLICVCADYIDKVNERLGLNHCEEAEDEEDEEEYYD